MDNWYRSILIPKKESKSIHSNMMYATEAAFNRGSMTVPSSSFYDETSANKSMMPGELRLLTFLTWLTIYRQWRLLYTQQAWTTNLNQGLACNFA